LIRKDGGRLLTNEGIFWIPTGLSPSGQVPVDPLTLIQPGVSPTNTGSSNPPTISAPGAPPNR